MKKILIVDDVQSWRNFHKEIINDILKNEELSIITANSATEAYNILQKKDHLDLIITDLQMEDDYSPKLAGEWLVEQIKSFNCYKNTKTIIISASYNVRIIAEKLEVLCIPKATAIKCISAYEELIKN